MRTLSIPMMIDLLNDDNMPKYLAELKKAKPAEKEAFR